MRNGLLGMGPIYIHRLKVYMCSEGEQEMVVLVYRW
jgi:hypothetical protein